MATKKQVKRRTSSGCIRVTPEFRKEPDMEKMVRALIAIAEKMAREKEQAAA
jgi:hypothetical protein